MAVIDFFFKFKTIDLHELTQNHDILSFLSFYYRPFWRNCLSHYAFFRSMDPE